MQRRRLALLTFFIVILLAALVGLTLLISNVLRPVGATEIEPEAGEGMTLQWIRSVYGLGSAQADLLLDPVSVSVASDGRIFVPQPELNSICVFTNSGAPDTRIVNEEKLLAPNAVESGPDDRLFVADKGRNKIIAFDSSGEFLWESEANLVSDILWAGDRLYAAGFDRIYVFDIDGNRLFEWGSRGYADGEFDFPQGLVLAEDELLVSDGHNARVQAFSVDGEHLWSSNLSPRDSASTDTTATSTFQLAGGMCATPDGKFLVVDPLQFGIVALDDTGAVIGRVGSEGSEDGKFWYPSDIASLGDGRYVVSDTMNNRLQVVDISFGDSDGMTARELGQSISSAWCILPIALLILTTVGVVAWVSGTRRRTAEIEIAEEPSAE